MTSIVIATNNRGSVLKECLKSLNQQTLLPEEIIIAHGGGDLETRSLIDELQKDDNFKIKLRYFDFGPTGPAIQRNKGIEKSTGNIIFFLDDDVICEPDYIKEIVRVFDEDVSESIGGACGIVVNSSYTPFSKLNKFLFDFCLTRKERMDEYAGRVVGPAVNFWPKDCFNYTQEVQWMASNVCAYRNKVLSEYKFNENFPAIALTEDLELSCRVAKRYKLINTTRARLYHKDLGGRTRRDWVKVGSMQVLTRWYIMTNVLGKNTAGDKFRFFYYQIYCIITEIKCLFKWPDAKNTILRCLGRLVGIFNLLAPL